MKLARHQNKSLQECMQTNTSLEFVDWCIYDQELKWQEKEKLDYYLAQIASEIRRLATAFGGDKNKTSIDDCILPFEMKDSESKTLLSKPPEHRTMRPEQEDIIPETLKLQEEEIEDNEPKVKYKNPFEYHPDSIWIPMEGEEGYGEPIKLNAKWQAKVDMAKTVWAERSIGHQVEQDGGTTTTT